MWLFWGIVGSCMFTPTIASQFHFVIISKDFSFDMLHHWYAEVTVIMSTVPWSGWTSHSCRCAVTWACRVGAVMQKGKSGHFIWMAYFKCWNVVLQLSAWSRNLRERMTSASKIPSATPSFAILLFSSSVKVRSDLQCLFCSHLLGQPSCQQCLPILSQMPVFRTSAVCLCVSGSPDTQVHGLPQCRLSEYNTNNPQSWILFSTLCLLLINSKWFVLVHLLFFERSKVWFRI